MRHIGFYNSGDAVQTAIDDKELGKPYVVYLNDEHRLDWNSKSPTPAPLERYLTFEVIGDGYINWVTSNTSITKTIEYSKDNGNSWNEITSTTGGTQIPVVSGDTVLFRGNNAGGYSSGSYNVSFLGTTCSFNLKGNIMSLFNPDPAVFSLMTSLPDTQGVPNQGVPSFFLSTNVVDASALLLPATTLTQDCYSSMFYGCSNLISAPRLPATVLGEGCYSFMFSRCTKLTIAPDLPATILTISCYEQMFARCSKLNYVKCLATDMSARNCTQYWFDRTPATGTFVKHPNATWERSTSGIPTGWTVQDA